MERNEEDDGELKQRSKTFLERPETLTPLVDERIKEWKCLIKKQDQNPTEYCKVYQNDDNISKVTNPASSMRKTLEEQLEIEITRKKKTKQV